MLCQGMQRIFFLLVVAFLYGCSAEVSDKTQNRADLGGPITLTNQSGQTVTETIFNDKWTALFFGFTHCPDICPTTLVTLRKVQDQLASKTDLQVVFITVDPARDTPDILKAYLASDGLPKNSIGLTGTQEQVDATLKTWRVYAQKSDDTPNYNMDHSSVIYLVAPDGQVSAVSTSVEDADTIAAKFSTAIQKNSRL